MLQLVKRRQPSILLLGCFALISLSGCFNQSVALEHRLCGLYESVNTQEIKDVTAREGLLAELIQAELPAFFNEHYVNLIQVEWSQRATTMDRLLDAVDQNRRSASLCEPILQYYSQM